MLKQRILTAAVLIPIVLAILFFMPQPAFCLLAAALILGAAYEWTSLMQLTQRWSRLLYVGLMLGLMTVVLFYVPVPDILLGAFLWWLLALVLVVFYPRGTIFWSHSKVVKGIMGGMVLIPCWVALCYLRNGEQGTWVLLYVFVLIWGADSAAYFVGKKWGTTKLAPMVSPGKSVQGMLGAVAFTLVLSVVAGLLTHAPGVILFYAVMLSMTTVLFSILGDLFESMFKREAGVKDSGSILPGHGGLLDRIDSLTAAAPIYAFGSLVLSILFSS